MKKILLFLLIITGTNLFAQVYSNKVTKSDTSEYPYVLPIWGEKAHKLGFDLPYSAGLGINYLYQESSIIIDNLQVGFNNSEMYNLDEIVRFNDASVSANALNFRPDIWLFPFLNVYAVFAKLDSKTDVDFGIYIPENDSAILSAHTVAEFSGTTFGFGMTPTIGVKGGWIALDMNFAWTDMDALEKPAFSFVFGPRFGKTFKLKKPEQNIAVWVGGFRLNIKSETTGSLPLSDLFEAEEMGLKIDQGQESVSEAYTKLDDWWNTLTPPQQANPVNKAKYEKGTAVLDKTAAFLDAAEGAVTTVGESTVNYSLDKKQEMMWNLLVGTQFQINKHFMIRAEGGFFGTRTQFIGGLQYRFGL
jgi:hypothetical protein